MTSNRPPGRRAILSLFLVSGAGALVLGVRPRALWGTGRRWRRRRRERALSEADLYAPHDLAG